MNIHVLYSKILPISQPKSKCTKRNRKPPHTICIELYSKSSGSIRRIIYNEPE